MYITHSSASFTISLGTSGEPVNVCSIYSRIASVEPLSLCVPSSNTGNLPSGLMFANDPDVKSSGITRMAFTGIP
jgi:hypothetical protein